MFFFQAEDGIRDLVRSRGLGDVYKRQGFTGASQIGGVQRTADFLEKSTWTLASALMVLCLSLIHI